MIGIEPILIDLQSKTLPLCYITVVFIVTILLLLCSLLRTFSTTARSRTVTLLRLYSGYLPNTHYLFILKNLLSS